MKKLSRSDRHRLIIEIVSSNEVPNQEALAHELTKRGHYVTQTTVSRDLTELNMVKTKRGYACPTKIRGPVSPLVGSELLRQLTLSAETAGNLVVVKTILGSASQLAILFDSGMYIKVVGTIAGADTVAIFTRSPEEASRVKRELEKLTGRLAAAR